MMRTELDLPPLAGYQQLADALNVSEQTIRRWVAARRFPQPLRLGPRRLAWRRAAIVQWLADQESAAEVNG